MVEFEPLSEFLKNKSKMILLMTTDGKPYVSYDINFIF